MIFQRCICFALTTCLGLASLASADELRVADNRAEIERKQREIKAQHDRAVAEHKKQFQQMERQIKAEQERIRKKQLSAAGSGSASSAASSLPSTPAFNPASAPSPEDCLWAFVR